MIQITFAVLVWTVPVWAADKDAPKKDEKKADQKAPVRNFYEVLNDLVSDFEVDVKNGDVQGLKNMAIRNIATSENIPPSFKQIK
jgi:hypothetical protein